ncbi:MAG: hypothetical protein EOO61_11125 [Hymenobacter sp.]|nr:MAG: hypothetical protein EOO61_11125 [Hymenobacter sp.]
MRPISAGQLELSSDQAVYAANSRRIHISTPDQISISAVEATMLSLNRDLAAAYMWFDIIQGCRRTGAILSDTLFGQTYCDKTLGEAVLLSGDWRSIRLLVSAIPEGTYADGSIVRSSKQFSTPPDAEGKCFGFLSLPGGGWYGGDIKDGYRHGNGLYSSAHQTSHLGGWFKDKKHGYGCSEMTFPRYFRQEGLFSSGILVEPKKKSFREYIHGAIRFGS